MQTSTRYTSFYKTILGDTLNLIAAVYGITASDFGINNQDLLNLYTFNSALPEGTNVRVQDNIVENSMIPITSCSYVFKSGNDLNTVATVLGSNVDSLLFFGDTPRIGGLITASGCYNTSNGLYITKMGDTFDSIARQFVVSIESLALYNNIAGDIISPLPPGQSLVIPNSQNPLQRRDNGGFVKLPQNGLGGQMSIQPPMNQ
jgi:LysM repeat protein